MKTWIIRGLAVVLCLSGLAATASAQAVVDHRVWALTTLAGPIGQNTPWRWSVDWIVRSHNGIQELDTAAVRPYVVYALDKHSSVGGGYAFAPQYPASGGTVNEHRIFEQYIWTGAASGGTFTTRTRLEQRFVEGNSGGISRLREQVRFAHPIKTGSKTSLVGYDELFTNLNTTTRSPHGIDQNRAFAGFSQTLNKTTRVELGYLHNFVPGHGKADKINHVLSGTLLLTF